MEEIGGLKPVDYKSFIGKELGNVTILKELGRGNRGVVFLAFQKSLKRQVAVKILPKTHSTNEIERQQFRDEAEIVAGLSHPNIIPIFEMGEVDDFYFQVMQLIKGNDLNTIINDHLKHPIHSKRVIPVEETIDIVIQVLDGLSYAHEEEVIHQDIKPANILMEERTKRPLISDFGIAKTAQMEHEKQLNVVYGSPLYLSPEQAAAKETDKRTDIYSVGVLLFKMLVGFLPYRKESLKNLLFRKIKNPDTFFSLLPSQASPSINSSLEKIILKAISASLEDRYQNAESFQDDLERYRNKYFGS
jgi:serine/threonine-protein kinase